MRTPVKALQDNVAERAARVDDLRRLYQRIDRELRDAMADEHEARELLAAEQGARVATLCDAASNWEVFGELVATGVDPVKAAMIARDDNGAPNG